MYTPLVRFSFSFIAPLSFSLLYKTYMATPWRVVGLGCLFQPCQLAHQQRSDVDMAMVHGERARRASEVLRLVPNDNNLCVFVVGAGVALVRKQEKRLLAAAQAETHDTQRIPWRAPCIDNHRRGEEGTSATSARPGYLLVVIT